MPRSLALFALLLAIGAACPAAAQQIRLQGDQAEPAVRLFREILERGDYRVIARDTVLPADFRLEGDLIVLGADVRLEGVVEGAAAVLDGGWLFVRPGAAVRGPVALVGGDLAASAQAELGEVLRLHPSYQAVTLRADGGDVRVTVLPPDDRPVLATTGVLGLGMPGYNRVDGLTVPLGARLRLDGLRRDLRLGATLLYHTARNDLGGVAELELPLARGTWLELQAARRTFTNEGWIRGELENSLAFAWGGFDARNYYESDRLSVRLGRRLDEPPVAGELRLLPFAGGMLSRDRSLVARDVFTLFGEPRSNPAVAEGELVSAFGGTELVWRGTSSRFDGEGRVEWAPRGAGDFEFAQWTLDGAWQMLALFGHTIGVRGHAIGTFGDLAPPQRWSILGDAGTLPLLEAGALRGDRLAFVETVYAIPLPALQLPVGGVPLLQLRHAAGTAWLTGTPMPDWTQNVAAGLQVSVLRLTAWVDPADDPSKAELILSATLPF